MNVLAHPKLSMAEIAGAGAQRVSLGANLAWVAYGALAEVAAEIRDTGDFSRITVPAAMRDLLS